MKYQGVWGIPFQEIEAFFQKLPDCKEEQDYFLINSCKIIVESLAPKEKIHIPQTRVTIVGEEEKVNQLYQKLLYAFLSAGG